MENYEKKSAEVRSDPFVIEEGGKGGIISRASCSVSQQVANGYSDEKVKQILVNTIKQHCVEIGYTYDKDPVIFKSDRGEWVATAYLRKSLFSARSGLRGSDKFAAPTVKGIFDYQNKLCR